MDHIQNIISDKLKKNSLTNIPINTNERTKHIAICISYLKIEKKNTSPSKSINNIDFLPKGYDIYALGMTSFNLISCSEIIQEMLLKNNNLSKICPLISLNLDDNNYLSFILLSDRVFSENEKKINLLSANSFELSNSGGMVVRIELFGMTIAFLNFSIETKNKNENQFFEIIPKDYEYDII